MHILALETNRDKLIHSHIGAGEHLVLAIGFHWLRFFVHCILSLLYTGILLAIGIGIGAAGAPSGSIFWGMLIIWIILIGWPLFRRFVDWKYDILIVTSDTIVFVDQSSLIKRHVRQMNLENIAAVESITQYWGIFPFGKVSFNLKEGLGGALILTYIPQAARVASIITEVMVKFERSTG